MKKPADFTLQSNIDLDNQNWAGIQSSLTVDGNYKTISNMKLKGNKSEKTAGFINTTGDCASTIKNLTFNGVQTDITTISGGQYDVGIGAIIGNAKGNVTLQRVIVKLAGDNFGTKADKNVLTANVGGLIGLVDADKIRKKNSATMLTVLDSLKISTHTIRSLIPQLLMSKTRSGYSQSRTHSPGNLMTVGTPS